MVFSFTKRTFGRLDKRKGDIANLTSTSDNLFKNACYNTTFRRDASLSHPSLGNKQKHQHLVISVLRGWWKTIMFVWNVKATFTLCSKQHTLTISSPKIVYEGDQMEIMMLFYEILYVATCHLIDFLID